MINKYAPQLKAMAFVCLLSFFSFQSFSQVGIGTTNPNGGAMLDVESGNKAMLIPRVNIANLATLAPITGGQDEGMLVYNTNTTTGPGFFYWNSNTTTGAWVPVGDGNGTEAWSLTGNTGTTPGTGAGNNYLGTSDGQDLVIATAGTERVRVLGSGNVGIGASPTTKLDVNGALSLKEGTALALVNGTNNNISLGTTPNSFYRITGPTAAFSINSIIPVTGSDGQIVTIQNTTSQIMTIIHNTTGGGPNRIFVPGGSDLIIRGQYASVTLQYNTSQNRWLVQNEVNHIETWYGTLANIANGYNTYTFTLPGITSNSTASVNFVGPVPAAIAFDLVIEYIETRANAVVIRIYNFGGALTNGAVAIGINKI